MLIVSKRFWCCWSEIMIDVCALQRCKFIVWVVTPNGKQVKTMPQIDCNVEQTWISPPILNSLSRGPLYRAVWSAFLGQALPLPVVIIALVDILAIQPIPCPLVTGSHGIQTDQAWPRLSHALLRRQMPDIQIIQSACLAYWALRPLLLGRNALLAWTRECHPTHALDLTIWKF